MNPTLPVDVRRVVSPAEFPETGAVARCGNKYYRTVVYPAYACPWDREGLPLDRFAIVVDRRQEGWSHRSTITDIVALPDVPEAEIVAAIGKLRIRTGPYNALQPLNDHLRSVGLGKR